MKYVNKKNMTLSLLATALIVVGYLFSSDGQTNTQRIKVKGDVEESVSAEITELVTKVFKNETLPEEIEVGKVKEDDLEAHYIAGWQRQDQLFYNALLVKNKDSNEAKYKRAWVIFLREEIDEEFSESIVKQVFNADHLDNAQTDLSCRKVTSRETQEEQTECFSMKDLEDGRKVGLSVTFPVTLPSSSTGVFVTTCLVPEEGAPFYKEDTCI